MIFLHTKCLLNCLGEILHLMCLFICLCGSPWYIMPPKTYKGKRPAAASSHFNTKRFKDVECAERFELRFINQTIIFERIVVQTDLSFCTGFILTVLWF